jgi:hypothetical protein
MKAIKMICISLLIWAQTTIGEDVLQLPPNLRQFADQILQAADKYHLQLERGELSDTERVFTQAVDRLGGELDEEIVRRFQPWEGRNIESKLVAIAWDKSQNASLYEEIEREYILKFDAKQHVPMSQALRESHATEKYRLVWEYYLLRPPTKPPTAFKYDLRAMEALQRIHNKNSVLTLLHCYRMSSQKGVSSRTASTRQAWLFQALSEFRDEQGLRALIECVLLSKQQQSQENSTESSFNAERAFFRLLGGEFGHGEEWRAIASALPKDGLSQEQLQLLQNVLQASPPPSQR